MGHMTHFSQSQGSILSIMHSAILSIAGIVVILLSMIVTSLVYTHMQRSQVQYSKVDTSERDFDPDKATGHATWEEEDL